MVLEKWRISSCLVLVGRQQQFDDDEMMAKKDRDRAIKKWNSRRDGTWCIYDD